ncbi:MAG: polyprenol monophosphomannose synthase [Deltaproteobacteria bacterium]|nr:polyprenol monophosphomannose synthase [Deltaproteobacteria bacterium]
MSKTFVVLPTYNEIENLQKIVEAIFYHLPHTHLLIVDDNSPDGTGKIADQLASEKPEQIFVLHRLKKEGLGRAYLAGFKRVLELGAEIIIQMDADFSHPPSLLPLMIKELAQVDFVLPSRYIKNGGTQNWGVLRQIISRGGNLYARLVLKSPVHDLTGGFKAFRRPVLEYLLSCPIQANGYSFQIEMTTRALQKGFHFKEIPFIFVDREDGKSKMSKKIVFEALFKTYRLRKELLQKKTLTLSSVLLQENKR